ncbi:hypothetical protein Droror1_Dr00015011 [Drosera rotundifolia]
MRSPTLRVTEQHQATTCDADSATARKRRSEDRELEPCSAKDGAGTMSGAGGEKGEESSDECRRLLGSLVKGLVRKGRYGERLGIDDSGL